MATIEKKARSTAETIPISRRLPLSATRTLPAVLERITLEFLAPTDLAALLTTSTGFQLLVKEFLAITRNIVVPFAPSNANAFLLSAIRQFCKQLEHIQVERTGRRTESERLEFILGLVLLVQQNHASVKSVRYDYCDPNFYHLRPARNSTLTDLLSCLATNIASCSKLEQFHVCPSLADCEPSMECLAALAPRLAQRDKLRSLGINTVQRNSFSTWMQTVFQNGFPELRELSLVGLDSKSLETFDWRLLPELTVLKLIVRRTSDNSFNAARFIKGNRLQSVDIRSPRLNGQFDFPTATSVNLTAFTPHLPSLSAPAASTIALWVPTRDSGHHDHIWDIGSMISNSRRLESFSFSTFCNTSMVWTICTIQPDPRNPSHETLNYNILVSKSDNGFFKTRAKRSLIPVNEELLATAFATSFISMHTLCIPFSPVSCGTLQAIARATKLSNLAVTMVDAQPDALLPLFAAMKQLMHLYLAIVDDDSKTVANDSEAKTQISLDTLQSLQLNDQRKVSAGSIFSFLCFPQLKKLTSFDFGESTIAILRHNPNIHVLRLFGDFCFDRHPFHIPALPLRGLMIRTRVWNQKVARHIENLLTSCPQLSSLAIGSNIECFVRIAQLIQNQELLVPALKRLEIVYWSPSPDELATHLKPLVHRIQKLAAARPTLKMFVRQPWKYEPLQSALNNNRPQVVISVRNQNCVLNVFNQREFLEDWEFPMSDE